MATGKRGEEPQNDGHLEEERLRRDDMARDGTARENENYGEHEMTTREREIAAERTDPERRRKLREKYDQRVLPTIPERQGWHRCWVSTTHPMDTPSARQRMGYRFVKMDDLRDADWVTDKNAVKDGQYDGAVRWRELVLMELPTSEYVDYMREFHHDAPQDQAQGIFEQLDELSDRARSKGGRITLEEGMADLRRRIQSPPARQFEV